MVLTNISPKGTANYIGKPPRLTNQKVLIEDKHARETLDSLLIIVSDGAMVDEGLQNGGTYENLRVIILLLIKDETLSASTYRILRMRRPFTSP